MTRPTPGEIAHNLVHEWHEISMAYVTVTDRNMLIDRVAAALKAERTTPRDIETSHPTGEGEDMPR